jgi:hypothetical protein
MYNKYLNLLCRCYKSGILLNLKNNKEQSQIHFEFILIKFICYVFNPRYMHKFKNNELNL